MHSHAFEQSYKRQMVTSDSKLSNASHMKINWLLEAESSKLILNLPKPQTRNNTTTLKLKAQIYQEKF